MIYEFVKINNCITGETVSGKGTGVVQLKNRKENKIRWIFMLWFGMLFLTGCSGGGSVLSEEVEWMTEAGTGEGFQTEELQISEQKEIAVYVCGAVKTPGVYYLPEASRLYEAVERAGGFLETADKEWLNQAELLQDGEKVMIYTRDETDEYRAQGLYRNEASGSNTDMRVNLNTASREELMTLTGIGQAKADAIVAYRQDHGGFQSIEEIMEISGIKEAVFLKIKDRITV